MACWSAARRRAEMATPRSQRVPTSMRKPKPSSMDLSLRLPARSSESTRMTRTPDHFTKCTSQSKVASRALMECSRQSNESNIELTAREATCCCRRDATIAAAMQFKHLMGALRTRQDDSMELGTPGKLNHRLDDLLARGCGFALVHHRSPFIRTMWSESKGGVHVATRPAEEKPAGSPWSAGPCGV
jgi:hypothetical protein